MSTNSDTPFDLGSSYYLTYDDTIASYYAAYGDDEVAPHGHTTLTQPDHASDAGETWRPRFRSMYRYTGDTLRWWYKNAHDNPNSDRWWTQHRMMKISRLGDRAVEPTYLHIDIDGEDDLTHAGRQALKLGTFLRLHDAAVLLYFSGSKGFHLEIPAACYDVEGLSWMEHVNAPAIEYDGYTKADVDQMMVRRLARRADIDQEVLDDGIYKRTAKWRLPGCPRKYGLEKIWMGAVDDDIDRLIERPRALKDLVRGTDDWPLPPPCTNASYDPRTDHEPSELLVRMRGRVHDALESDAPVVIDPSYDGAYGDGGDIDLTEGSRQDLVEAVKAQSRKVKHVGNGVYQVACPCHHDKDSSSAYLNPSGGVYCYKNERFFLPHEVGEMVGVDVEYEDDSPYADGDDSDDGDDADSESRSRYRDVDDLEVGVDGLHYGLTWSPDALDALTDDIDGLAWEEDPDELEPMHHHDLVEAMSRHGYDDQVDIRPIRLDDTEDDLARVRDYLKDDLHTLMDRQQSAWIRCSTGVGKSHGAREVIAERDVSALWMAESHRLLDETRLHLMDLGEDVLHLEPYDEAESRCHDLPADSPVMDHEVDTPSRADEIKALQDVGESRFKQCATCPLNPMNDVPLEEADDDVDTSEGHCESILQLMRATRDDVEDAIDGTNPVDGLLGYDDDLQDELDDVDESSYETGEHTLVPTAYLPREVIDEMLDGHDLAVIDEDPISWWREVHTYDPSDLECLLSDWFCEGRTMSVGGEEVDLRSYLYRLIHQEPGDEGVQSLPHGITLDLDDDIPVDDRLNPSRWVRESLEDHLDTYYVPAVDVPGPAPDWNPEREAHDHDGVADDYDIGWDVDAPDDASADWRPDHGSDSGSHGTSDHQPDDIGTVDLDDNDEADVVSLDEMRQDVVQGTASLGDGHTIDTASVDCTSACTARADTHAPCVSDVHDVRLDERPDGPLQVEPVHTLGMDARDQLHPEASRFMRDLFDEQVSHYDIEAHYHDGDAYQSGSLTDDTESRRRLYVSRTPDPLDTDVPVWVLDATAHDEERRVIEEIAGEDVTDLRVPLYNPDSKVIQDPVRGFSRTSQRRYVGEDPQDALEVAQALQDGREDDVDVILDAWDGRTFVEWWCESFEDGKTLLRGLVAGADTTWDEMDLESLYDGLQQVSQRKGFDDGDTPFEWYMDETGLKNDIADREVVDDLIDYVDDLDGSVAVISQKNSPVVGELVETFPDKMESDTGEMMVGHYQGLRGLDYMNGSDHLILLGDPSPHKRAFITEGVRWGLEAPEAAFEHTDGYSSDHFQLNYERMHDTRQSELSQLVWQRVISDEMHQAIGRVRPLTNDGVTIHAFCTVDVDHPGLEYEVTETDLKTCVTTDQYRRLYDVAQTTWLGPKGVADRAGVGERHWVADIVDQATPIRVAQTRQLFKRGLSKGEVASEMEVTTRTLSSKLDEHDIDMWACREEAIRGRLERGESKKDIAEALDIGRRTFYRWMDRLDIDV